jgi:hypothetical protein
MPDFPANPSSGEIFEVASGVYRWDGTKWTLLEQPEEIGVPWLVANPVGSNGVKAIPPMFDANAYLSPPLMMEQIWNEISGGGGGVSSFNTRTGAVTLTTADVTGAGGALLASPAFTGTPQAPTPTAADNSTNIATTAFVAGSLGSYLPLSGGTITSTLAVNGQLTTSSIIANGAMWIQGASSYLRLTPSSGNPLIQLNAAAVGAARQIQGATALSLRWYVNVGDSTAESGSNAGSNFSILACSDAGAVLTTPLSINRASGAVTIHGSSTNDSAAAGFVGETIAAAITTNQAMTTGVALNVGSVSLTAGDWDVDGYVQFVPSAAPTALACGINATSATMPVGNTQYSTQQLVLAFTSAATQVLNTGRTRVSLAATTSVYLVAQGTFASGTLNAQGYISARRRR